MPKRKVDPLVEELCRYFDSLDGPNSSRDAAVDFTVKFLTEPSWMHMARINLGVQQLRRAA